jgi:hypothetical protein
MEFQGNRPSPQQLFNLGADRYDQIMDDESKSEPLDYAKPPPKRRGWQIFLIIVGTTIVCFIAAFAAAVFLLRGVGGGH